MKSYKDQSFLKLAIRFGLLFLIVITGIKIIAAIATTGSFSGMVDKYFSTSTWYLFAKMQLLMAALYGAFMAGYYKFIKKD